MLQGARASCSSI
uniref:Uncharacterized protein n=1 Tax=Arundo donax TaxID=35708 RepID=A0A0A8YLH0_ARUDO